ncbi:type-F conjugative transfer system pilin assembly protein TrbC, partial [Escherichia coli]|nr:type-F conjugative transfer system pilin assembly protein TrbC [Escherichia coli]
PTTYLVDTTLSNSSDSDQTVQAVRLLFCSQGHDIIRGNLRVRQALEKVAATGDCRQVAQGLLDGTGDKSQ